MARATSSSGPKTRTCSVASLPRGSGASWPTRAGRRPTRAAARTRSPPRSCVHSSRAVASIDRDGLAITHEAIDSVTERLTEGDDLVWAIVATMQKHLTTHTHAINTAIYAVVLAQYLHVTKREEVVDIGRGALLHDIGKTRIPDRILDKPGPLTKPEWKVIQGHPMTGIQLVTRALGYVPGYGHIIAEHHERADGSGYPGGRRSNQVAARQPAGRDRRRLRRPDVEPLVQGGVRRPSTRCGSCASRWPASSTTSSSRSSSACSVAGSDAARSDRRELGARRSARDRGSRSPPQATPGEPRPRCAPGRPGPRDVHDQGDRAVGHDRRRRRCPTSRPVNALIDLRTISCWPTNSSTARASSCSRERTTTRLTNPRPFGRSGRGGSPRAAVEHWRPAPPDRAA